jgi:CDP-2,3-bis-(O-geranylgeranyl)-sn-glycerol synthase
VSSTWPAILTLLILVLLANGLPAIIGLALGPGRPIDAGRQGPDGQPLLGTSKTWRGLAAALLVTPLVGMALGVDWQLGLMIAAGAMIGDLGASFIKRRLRADSGTSMPLLDTVPESLIPGLLVIEAFALGWAELLLLVCAFGFIDLLLTPLGHWAAARLRR